MKYAGWCLHDFSVQGHPRRAAATVRPGEAMLTEAGWRMKVSQWTGPVIIFNGLISTSLSGAAAGRRARARGRG